MNGSTNAHLFAPGKLIWMGEYTVLDGAPSIVQAVDRGLHLDYAPSDASLTVSSDLWAGNLLLTDATADRAETALLAAVVATLTEAGAALAQLTGTLKLASPDLIDATTGLKFGFGSSAAAAAALTVALGRLAGLPDDRLSALAHAAHRRFQKGAGSGVDVETSLFGGFARMHAGTRADGTDAFAEPLFDEHHWDLRVVIAVTVEGEKEVASTDGMNLTDRTSPYYPAWIETVEPDVQSAITALAARDFDHLARIAEASALRMHASAIAADPGVLYWRGATVEVIHEVRRLRAGGLPVFFTIDAGPHVKVFAPADEVSAVVRALEATPGVLRTIVTAPAAGAHLVHG